MTDDHELTDTEWRAFQAIPEQGFSHRAWIDTKIGQRILELEADRDTWRAAREQARDETEEQERVVDAIRADLHATRARLGQAEGRIQAAFDAIALHAHRKYPDPAMYLYDESVGPLIKAVLHALEEGTPR